MLNICCQLSNLELFWVVTEVCTESNVIRRVRIVQLFIKLASRYFFYFAPERGVQYCSQHVCMYVCLSAGLSKEPDVQTWPYFLSLVPVTVARSSCGSIVMHYELPVVQFLPIIRQAKVTWLSAYTQTDDLPVGSTGGSAMFTMSCLAYRCVTVYSIQ